MTFPDFGFWWSVPYHSQIVTPCGFFFFFKQEQSPKFYFPPKCFLQKRPSLTPKYFQNSALQTEHMASKASHKKKEKT